MFTSEGALPRISFIETRKQKWQRAIGGCTEQRTAHFLIQRIARWTRLCPLRDHATWRPDAVGGCRPHDLDEILVTTYSGRANARVTQDIEQRRHSYLNLPGPAGDHPLYRRGGAVGGHAMGGGHRPRGKRGMAHIGHRR